ncbi:MAG: flagellar biosynthesis protein FlhB [Pseudomonadota bacterium]|nr:flagellar biosynthesis protein FlhB [Pseudomonadota bacterium]
MSEVDDSEKTEEATPLRREEFRNRGQVAQTKELSAVFMLFGLTILFWFLGRFMLEQFFLLFTELFGDGLVRSVKHGFDYSLIKLCVIKGLLIVGPMLGIIFLLTVASSVVQVGILTNEEFFELKWERINPIQGFKRLFSLRSLVEGFKSLLKVTLVCGVAYLTLKHEIKTIPFLVSYGPMELLAYASSITFKLLSTIGVFMAVIAAMDYFFQYWELEKSMRMSKQEIKEELKSREGDPMIRARIRRVQREMAQKRMMQEVPKADVIVTNPTHIAVAIKYELQKMAAPIIVAMGAGIIAEKIKEIARSSNVPIVENKPLARTIFKSLKVGQVVPRELYNAVAEVLSYVFKLKKKRLT